MFIGLYFIYLAIYNIKYYKLITLILLVGILNTEAFLCGFMTMQRKKILARAVEIQKENWGNHAFFRDN